MYNTKSKFWVFLGFIALYIVGFIFLSIVNSLIANLLYSWLMPIVGHTIAIGFTSIASIPIGLILIMICGITINE